MTRTTRTGRLAFAVAATAFAIATIWPFRSHYLISWDAANFAFALDRIDIAAHRPHPPGYLGYVFAGRALRWIFTDANAALTAWNVAVRSAAAVLVGMFAFSASRGSMRAAVAAAAILLTSPLLWFYASNAEIYPSEMAFALATVFAASASLRGDRAAVVATALVLAITALFKISAMVLLLPLGLYTWWHWRPDDRKRAAWLFAAVFGAIALLFFVLQPNVLQLLWGQFAGATAPSRLGGTATNYGRTLNRNVRDTVVNLAAALGVVNSLAFLFWLIAVRRLPPAVDRRQLSLWAGPWFVLLIFVHIGNPGYVLPLLPVFCLVLGVWYSQLSPATFAAVAILQAIVNLGQIAFFAPPVAGGEVKYGDKSFVQRVASDLQPLTFPTLATVRRSDVAVDRLLELAASCRSGPWVIVSSGDPVDWRRASYYLPEATSIRLTIEGVPESVSQNGGVRPATDAGEALNSQCGLIWLTTQTQDADVKGLPAGGVYEYGVGWVFPAGAGSTSTSGVKWIATD
ncbi:MAG TPA: hypothetical protein VJP86_12960 [Vicinamibacterales bacterium]|nr:hypothetical protein [Vicinamibacterales bacterium]